jgi:hypothetical protein
MNWLWMGERRSCAHLSIGTFGARHTEQLNHSSIDGRSDCPWHLRDNGRARLREAFGARRSLLPLLRGDANPSTSKAPASRTHSKRLAIKAGHFGSRASHFWVKLWLMPALQHSERGAQRLCRPTRCAGRTRVFRRLWRGQSNPTHWAAHDRRGRLPCRRRWNETPG